MATALSPFVSTKETTNYARLCRLLVDVGSQVLRSTFDKIHPPANLHTVLGSTSVHYTTLQSLYKGRKKVLNPTQWGKLYPTHSPASSATFDITLLTVLLRNICGLSAPATGWDRLPPAANISIADDIARVKYYRNNVYAHASQASVDDISFSAYWQEIREALVRLGGAHFRVDIDNLEQVCMDPDIEEHYRELMKQWKKDDDSIKDKLEGIEDSLEKMRHNFKAFEDTTEKIEIEIREMREKLSSLTTIAEKSRDEDTTKGSLEKLIGEMAKKDSELREVKKLCALTPPEGESKDEGRIKDIVKETIMKMENEMKEMKEKLDFLMASAKEYRGQGIFDPTELINGISQLYKTREGWLSPFPWCEEFQFFLGNIFTRLKVVRRNKTRGEVTDKFVDMSSILDPYEECSAPRTVLIEGEPGMGKTTYCKKYVYDWTTRTQEPQGSGLTAFKAVLLLKCRDIHSDVWEAIEDQLLPRDIDEEVKQQFFQFIRENQSSILLMLDGLDELPSSKLPMFSELIEGRVLPRCYIVATARHEAGKEVRKYCDTLLEIEGFTQKQVDEFVIKYFRDRPGLATKLLDRMKCETNLTEMAANPLNTALLCLLCEEFDGTLPENRAQLYLDMVECVLRRYRKKKGQAKTNTTVTNLYKPQLKRLGLVALNGLLNDKLEFDESALGNHANDLTAFGFLTVQTSGSKLRQKLHYAFLHKSFQECFAAFFICSQIQSKEITPEELVSDERYFGKLKQVLLFSCGILAMQCDEHVVVLVNSLTNQVNKHEGDGTKVVLTAINECKREKDFPLQLAKCFGSGLNLSNLDLSENSIGDAGATSIAEAIKVNKTLTNLNLSGNDISDAGATSIAEAIKANKTVTKLNLSRNHITFAGATAIAEAIKVNKTITNLNLCGYQITDPGATSIAEAIEVNKTLTNLNSLGNDISNAGAKCMAEAIRVNKTLTSLNFSYFRITCAGATSIAEAIIVNKTLTNLDLYGDDIADAGAGSIAEAIKVNKTLTNLNLSGNRITDDGATSIAEAIKVNKTLNNLNLSYNHITYAGATSIAEAIKVNKTLTNLYLSYNQISDTGAASFAEAIKVNKTLTNLYLSNNQISDTGATSIAEAIKVNKTLTNLNLPGNDISDAGATSIAEAIEVNKTLTNLNLSGYQITDGVLHLLLRQSKSSRLTNENMSGNDNSDASVTSIG